MATIRDITTMCRAGQVEKAYGLAKADYEETPGNVWTQRGLGWALYYFIKEDVEKRKTQDFYEHLKELTELELLTLEADSMIFDNVLWKLAEFLKNIPDENTGEVDRLFPLFSNYHFTPSKGYSFLLKTVLGFETWPRLVQFFEWWNVDKLLPEDYQPFKLENGRKIMSLAEQAYIAYAKALLRMGDKDKMRAFLPKIEKLMDDYPEMMYPGYFCGKLMLAMRAEREEALDMVMPFVRKKQSEFWVWQLLGDLYEDDKDVQLACLLCASHCRTQEAFLGKVRMKLVSLYVSRKDYARAKSHLDKMTRCYVQHGWRLPFEVQCWMKEAWVQNTIADESDGVDYKRYTSAILSRGANESIAVVTFVDTKNKRVFMVYGKGRRTGVRMDVFKFRVKAGQCVKLKWLPNANQGIDVVGVEKADQSSLRDISYVRLVEGMLEKHPQNPFGFIKKKEFSCYINPDNVQRHNLKGGETISVLAVWDYNKKKNLWNWSCVALNRKEDGKTEL